MGERGGALEGMDCMRDILNFYQGKKVFVTGHTGFKGTWLCKMLIDAGADVTGYALPAPTEPNLFAISGIEGKMNSMIGDTRAGKNSGAFLKKRSQRLYCIWRHSRL